MPVATVAAAIAFAVLGAAAERLASVWPPDEAVGRRPGARTALLAVAAAAAGGAIVARSELPAWATLVHLAALALMVVLAATDLEQRLLPHLVLDPLILLAVVFVPFNPGMEPLSALVGAGVGIAFLGALALVVRGGLALGDLYLALPIGLLLGWPATFTGLFVAGLLSAGASLALIATRRAGLGSYIPFGPFLVAGFVVALLTDPGLLQVVR